MRTGLVVLVASIFYFSFTTLIVAQAPSPPAGVLITLSEISACNSGGDWVEVYNPNDTPIDIGGWKIGKNKTGTASLSGTLAPKAYKKIDFPLSFANTGFAVTLIEPSSTEPIETFPALYKTNKDDPKYLQTCPTMSNPESWIKEGEDWKLTTQLTPDGANILVVVATPTPQPKADQPVAGAPTNTPTPKPQTPTPTNSATASPGIQPTGISLSEIYACQNENEKEWVELFNSGSAPVTLTDWKLADDDKNEQPIASLSIGSNGYAVIEITKYSKGMLTNSGDVVNLIDGTGKNVDTFTYKSCTKGSSWSRNARQWEENNPSKGTKNPQSLPTPQLEGDGGDIQVTSAMGAEESSASGYVLGTQDESTSSLEPTSMPQPRSKQSPNWIAYGSIGAGIVILSGVGAYYAWTFYKQRKNL